MRGSGVPPSKPLSIRPQEEGEVCGLETQAGGKKDTALAPSLGRAQRSSLAPQEAPWAAQL